MRKYETYLILNALMYNLCCFPLAIVVYIILFQIIDLEMSGREQEAIPKYKTCKILMIIGTAFGIISGFVFLVLAVIIDIMLS